MLSSKKRHNSLTEEKVYVLYKDNPWPARVIDVEKRGRKIYLLLRWENFGNEQFKPEKWVREALCVEFTPEGSQKPSYKAPGKMALKWWQKLIVKFQNIWYGRKA
jgi:hypothetical protein